MKALLESAAHGRVTEVSPPHDLAGSRSVPAADAAALSLVFLLIFCVVCFAMGAAVLGRREKRLTREDGPSPESADEGHLGTHQGSREANPKAWERESDWWKKST
jgi:hypothetical protein